MIGWDKTDARFFALLFLAAIAILFGPWKPGQVVTPAPVASATPKATTDLEATKLALAAVAALAGKAPAYAQPAVSVIREAIPQTKGLSDAEIALILSGLHAKTSAVYRVSSVLSGPTPAPTPAPPPNIGEKTAAWHHADTVSAVEEALQKTKIDTHVTVDQVERPPSRVGSVVLQDGSSGLSFTVKRRGQFDLDVAALQQGGHLAPGAAIFYRLPHTSLGIGPVVSFGGKTRLGLGASVRF